MLHTASLIWRAAAGLRHLVEVRLLLGGVAALAQERALHRNLGEHAPYLVVQISGNTGAQRLLAAGLAAAKAPKQVAGHGQYHGHQRNQSSHLLAVAQAL
jgi:hypothetical protein